MFGLRISPRPLNLIENRIESVICNPNFFFNFLKVFYCLSYQFNLNLPKMHWEYFEKLANEKHSHAHCQHPD